MHRFQLLPRITRDGSLAERPSSYELHVITANIQHVMGLHLCFFTQQKIKKQKPKPPKIVVKAEKSMHRSDAITSAKEATGRKQLLCLKARGRGGVKSIHALNLHVQFPTSRSSSVLPLWAVAYRRCGHKGVEPPSPMNFLEDGAAKRQLAAHAALSVYLSIHPRGASAPRQPASSDELLCSKL